MDKNEEVDDEIDEELAGPPCPICGTPSEECDEGYCYTCEAHICPICQFPSPIPGGRDVCSHYVFTEDGGDNWVDDYVGRDMGLLWAFEDPLTETQEAFLQSLSPTRMQQHFGSESVIGWKDSLKSFVTQHIPWTHSTLMDGPGSFQVFYHQDGGDAAWGSFLPLLQQQKAGRDWLIEQAG